MPEFRTFLTTSLATWLNCAKADQKLASSTLELQSLEDRILYSAGPMPIDSNLSPGTEATEQVDYIESMEAQLDQFSTLDELLVSKSAGSHLTPEFENESSQIELAIIDQSVEGYQELVDDLLNHLPDHASYELIYLAPETGGLEQITSKLPIESNYSTVHLISHGRDGELTFGATHLSESNLNEYAQPLFELREAMASNADLLIYGCNVAQSQTGERFIQALAEVLDADVAASDDITGHHTLGGDWTFEYSVGAIDTQAAFSSQLQSSWEYTLPVALPIPTEFDISGRVIEDVNGDGDLSEDVSIQGAYVYLYRDNGDGVMGFGDSYLSFDVTDSNGGYTFEDLNNSETYFVVVDSKTIASGSLNSGYQSDDVWAEQTYGSAGSAFFDGTLQFTAADGALFSGKTAGVSDDAFWLTTSEHVTRVELAGANVTDVDFGFSFNVVTNSLGGNSQDDDFATNDRSVQGSFRQFLTNANALAGANVMRFVPIVDADIVSGANSHWEIVVTEALPDLDDGSTVIDGRAFHSDGLTRFNANSAAHGSVGPVGVGADGVAGTGDESVLTLLDAPDLEISGGASVETGIVVKGADIEIGYISIHGFGLSGESGNIFVQGNDASGVYIHDNMIGSRANAFAAPDTALSQSTNIYVKRADFGTISNNLIGFGRDSGIKLERNANDWTIESNEIRSNATVSVNQDGIDIVRNSRRVTIKGNLIVGNSGYGIDSWMGKGEYNINNNTIVGNGFGGSETGGIRLMGNDNVVASNVISNNSGPGVNVIGEHNDDDQFDAATGNLITRNSFFENSGNAIDLTQSNSSKTILSQGDGISLNGVVSDSNAGNEGLDYPILTDAFLDSDGLHITGQFDASLSLTRLEIYLADSGSGDFNSGTAYGEGKTFLGDVVNSNLTSYNRFTQRFTATISEPAGGWPSELSSGGSVTAIAVQFSTGNTSEFGSVATLDHAPIAIDSEVTTNENQLLVFELSDFGFTDADSPAILSVRIESLPPGGTVYLNGVEVSAGTNVSAAEINAGRLTYLPDLYQNGNDYDSFEFRVGDGTTPNSNAATLTIDVTPVADNPIFNSGAKWNVDENRSLIGSIDAYDPDGNSLSYSIVGGVDQAQFQIDSTTGALSFVNNPDFETPVDVDGNNFYLVSVRVEDGTGGVSQQNLVIQVGNVQEAPNAVLDIFSVYEGGQTIHDVLSNDWDPEGGALKIEIVSGPSQGKAIVNAAGNLVYRHDGGESSQDVIVYKVTDATGRSDVANARINVIPVDDPTIAVADRLTAQFEEPLVIHQNALLKNDIDPDSPISQMEVVITSQPANGTVNIVNGVLTFTPDSEFVGVTKFSYFVDVNGVAGSSTEVNVVVSPQATVSNSSTEAEPVEETPEDADPELTPVSQPEDDEKVEIPINPGSKYNQFDYADEITIKDSPAKNSEPDHEFKLDPAGTTYVYTSRGGDIALTNLARSIIVSNPVEISQIDTSLAALMWDDLDSAKRDFMMGQVQLGVPTIAASAASFLTVGYLAWIIRGGVLLTTFMSSVPAWSSFDILSVIETGGKDESIEQMVDI